jgi:tetrahydromethanopterin S-methyltransferase subunit A
VSWPEIEGAYAVGDPAAPVAVCVLTSAELMAPLASTPGVAIAGEVQTANLGLERIVGNVVANPAIRFLLICGRESRLFRPGQSLAALVENGVDEAGQVRGAQGYEPVLRTLPPEAVDRFRGQVEVVDWTGELDLAELRGTIESLVRRRPSLPPAPGPGLRIATAGFVPLRPGGRREPLQHDPRGYFVVSLDRPAEQVVVRHYLADHTPAHEMRGRNGSSILLGLVREQLVSQLSHAGYLGAELAKADAALRLGLRYAQDRPLRSDAAEGEPAGGEPARPRMTAPLDAEHLALVRPGEAVQLVIRVEEAPADGIVAGTLLEPAEAGGGPRTFRQGHVPVRVRWDGATRVAMGGRDELAPGALLRVHGELREPGLVAAEAIAILTSLATVLSG